MTTQLMIMDAITVLAAKSLPELKRIYTDLVPKAFQRPCLLIQAVTDSGFAVNCKTIVKNSYFTLTVFDETDDYSHSDTRRLLEWQQKILDLFHSNYLQVGDRALSVKVSTGGRDWDKAYVDVQFSYHDNRDDSPDTTPLMESIETNTSLI